MGRRGSGGDNDKKGGQPPPIGDNDPPKRGGKGGRAPAEYEQVDRGPLTCGTCNGAGAVQREHLKVDSDGDAYSELIDGVCPTCNGRGTIG